MINKAFLMLSIVIFVNCANKKSISQNYKDKDIRSFQNIAVVEPFLIIHEIGKEEEINVTDLHKEEVDSFVIEFLNPMLSYSNSTYNKFSALTLEKDSILKQFSNVIGSGSVDSIFINNTSSDLPNSKYLLLLHISGWYKTKELRRKENWKSALWAIFTLGTVIIKYERASVTMHSTLINLQDMDIVYKEKIHYSYDPRFRNTIHRLINLHITQYFKRND